MATRVKKVESLSVDEMLGCLNEEEYVVLDIETTGLSPNKGGFLIEVAAVKIVNDEVVDTFSELINPGVKIYGKTIELTGITNEMVEGKPTYEEVLPRLYEFMGNSVIVAHNSQFDWNRFLLYYFATLGYYPSNNAVCTKRLFQKLEPERRVLKQGYGLTELVRHYNVEFDEMDHHRALVDTQATAEAFIKMRKDAIDRGLVKTPTIMYTVKSTKEESKMVTNVTIKNVRYWERKFGKKMMKRVYVNFEDNDSQYGTVYYDLMNSTWFVKEYWREIDLKAVESLVLKKVRKDSIEDYVSCSK